MDNSFDIIVIGTSFSGSFFLHSYLPKAKENARILVLERGQRYTHQWQVHNRKLSDIKSETTFINATPKKHWNHSIGFGGSSDMWWAVTLRMLPNDFKLKSVYGVGVDWPVTYDELEPYYTQAEMIMAVSGPSDGGPQPRSHPYPQPPHYFNDPDRLLKAAYPNLYFEQSCARARLTTGKRPHCCGIGMCGLCPVDSKFTISNSLAYLYDDPRVTLSLESEALAVEIAAGKATGVRYLKGGIEQVAKADLVVLGANAIFNPYLLLRSGLHHPLLGKRLNEQVSSWVTIDFDGLNNFQGSTSMTASGYMLYDGPHRSEYSACLMEVWNVPDLRAEKGRWQQRSNIKFVFEDLPDERNYVAVSANNPRLPETVYRGYSAYTQRGFDKLPELVSKVLAPLPVERVDIAPPSDSEGHILGTTLMGNDAATAIVDRYLLHHQIRNLMVLGSSVFPTCSPTNPTLTLTALVLWAVDHL